jgi:hypothetical protein
MTQELEKELVKFYLAPNSAREIERKYGVNLYQLKKLLAKYNIPMHSKSDAYKLRDERTKEVCLEKYGVTNPFASEEVKEKTKQTMLERYGVEYVGQAEISKQKTKEAFLEKYGVDSYTKTEEFKKFITDNKEVIAAKAKATCLEKYGVESVLLVPEVQKKKYETALARYGDGNFTNREKAKATALANYGTENLATVPEIKAKQQATKRKNGTFNTSKPEERFYTKLCEKYGSSDVVRQYKDKRYPFLCDFYIKSIDTFIELNISWTHGEHPFDNKNPADLAKLNQWREKAKTSKYYENAITTWTLRDPAKIAVARANQLNYILYYKEEVPFEQAS